MFRSFVLLYFAEKIAFENQSFENAIIIVSFHRLELGNVILFTNSYSAVL